MIDESYEKFIEEAFIDPIRSVLMVDDEYPTFDEILELQKQRNNGGNDQSEKSWTADPEALLRHIRKFRERSFLVDIHDGTDPSDGKDLTSHLHQSDLLILDYALDKTDPEDGGRAVNILRTLNKNDHFNLVVVHTSRDLDRAFDKVKLGLLHPSMHLKTDDREKARELIETGEQRQEGFTAALKDSIGLEQYFFYASGEAYLELINDGTPPYRQFYHQCNSDWDEDERSLVFRYLIEKFEQDNENDMNADAQVNPIWSRDQIRWVMTESVFIAFTDKNATDDILPELRRALKDWNPDPFRIFLTKLRAEFDEHGIVNQSKVLNRPHAFAHWYSELLVAQETQRRWLVAESVSRHSDQLLGTVLEPVEKFVTRFVEFEADKNHDATCKNYFGVDLSDNEVRKRSALEHNAFVCSKSPGGWHLSTGHIFMMEGEYWICLSPACDTVPSQISRSHLATFGERLPFFAVRLQRFNIGNNLPKDLNSNRYVFLEFDGETVVFCFNNPSGGDSAPDWYTFYAENRGEFIGNDFHFFLFRIEGDDTGVSGVRREARVVGQLRYEYALNLVHKLGGSLTRIGLNFADGRRR